MRTVSGTTNTNLKWMVGDHLGSTSITANYDGTSPLYQYYKPWGERRPTGPNSLPTDYTYTGQYSHTGDFGLMYYVARWYDPSLGRFAQADSIVPGAGNPMAWDRYAYALNSPLNYVDPSGHLSCSSSNVADGDCSDWDTSSDFGVSSGTGIAYANARHELIKKYGDKYVDEETGKIKDQALLGLIIAAEFGVAKGGESESYGEALEALSNQYHSRAGDQQTPCHGDCSLGEQLVWLEGKQGIREADSETINKFQNYLGDADKAIDGYQYGSQDTSWEWGNARYGSNIANDVTTGDYNLKGSKYITGYDTLSPSAGVFFVVTASQNLALTYEDRGW